MSKKSLQKTVNVLMVGVGGQGILLASDILSEAAMRDGHDVKKSEIHGMSQRGGSVFSHIRYGDKIYSPVIPQGKADILLSLEEMETARWVAFVHKKTHIIMANHRILPAMARQYHEGTKEILQKNFPDITTADIQKIKGQPGNIKTINVALLGLLSTFLDISKKAWHDSINANVPKGTFEDNIKAFEIGKTHFCRSNEIVSKSLRGA